MPRAPELKEQESEARTMAASCQAPVGDAEVVVVVAGGGGGDDDVGAVVGAAACATSVAVACRRAAALLRVEADTWHGWQRRWARHSWH